MITNLSSCSFTNDWWQWPLMNLQNNPDRSICWVNVLDQISEIDSAAEAIYWRYIQPLPGASLHPVTTVQCISACTLAYRTHRLSGVYWGICTIYAISLVAFSGSEQQSWAESSHLPLSSRRKNLANTHIHIGTRSKERIGESLARNA